MIQFKIFILNDLDTKLIEAGIPPHVSSEQRPSSFVVIHFKIMKLISNDLDTKLTGAGIPPRMSSEQRRNYFVLIQFKILKLISNDLDTKYSSMCALI